MEKRNYYRDNFDYRLSVLVNTYKKSDIKYGRGESTLTVDELKSLIEKGCYWCGEIDVYKLGADRIDTSKPHSLENCVCSCVECNRNRNYNKRKRPVIQYTIDDEFVAEYPSIKNAAKETGLKPQNIQSCCANKYNKKTTGGFIWKYK